MQCSLTVKEAIGIALQSLWWELKRAALVGDFGILQMIIYMLYQRSIIWS